MGAVRRLRLRSRPASERVAAMRDTSDADIAAPTTSVPPRGATLAYALLALAGLCWAGNHVLARAIAGHVPAAGLNAVRWTGVAIVIALFAGPALVRDWPVMRARWRTLAALGAAGGGIFGIGQFVALQHTEALNMSVMNSVAPAFIAGLGYLIFREKLSALASFGILVSIGGVLVIVSRLDAARVASLTFNRGDLIILANMALWALYSVCLRLAPKIDTASFLFALAVSAALSSVPGVMLEVAAGETLKPDLMTGGAIVYTTLISSLLAYGAWSRGVALIGAARAGVFLHLIPIYGVLLAGALLGEPVQLYHVAGFALILTGVTLVARR
jgi:drug/metabolite transporter (DMT)-like permease